MTAPLPFPDGVLVVDKPQGPTSHDVVALARRALGVSGIGHTGTLDPMATGVLPLVIGRATRLAQFLTASDKDYEATVRFGRTTNTYDAMGTVVTTSDERPTREQIEQALGRFRGTFEQTPPAFSAKNIDGARSYDIARKAKDGVVTLPSGLQYKVITNGSGTEHPLPDTTCACHYEGRTAQQYPAGKIFDSSYARGKPLSFAPNQVIQGWTEAMQLMVEGDKWEL